MAQGRTCLALSLSKQLPRAGVLQTYSPHADLRGRWGAGIREGAEPPNEGKLCVSWEQGTDLHASPAGSGQASQRECPLRPAAQKEGDDAGGGSGRGGCVLKPEDKR